MGWILSPRRRRLCRVNKRGDVPCGNSCAPPPLAWRLFCRRVRSWRSKRARAPKNARRCARSASGDAYNRVAARARNTVLRGRRPAERTKAALPALAPPLPHAVVRVAYFARLALERETDDGHKFADPLLARKKPRRRGASSWNFAAAQSRPINTRINRITSTTPSTPIPPWP